MAIVRPQRHLEEEKRVIKRQTSSSSSSTAAPSTASTPVKDGKKDLKDLISLYDFSEEEEDSAGYLLMATS